MVRGGYGLSYIHFNRLGGENLLSFNGPHVVGLNISQTINQPLCVGNANPGTCFRTTQAGYPEGYNTPASFNPLNVHVLDQAAAERFGVFGPLARRLAQAFWPGPLTLVVPRRHDAPIAPITTAGLATVALRVPSHPVAQALLRAAGRPIAAPSANRSGHVSPTTAAHVEADLGRRVAMLLDGGPTEVGVESTVLDATGDVAVLLRSGGVTAEAIERLTGQSLRHHLDGGTRPRSPGQLASHYAPRARLRLGAVHALPGEALLAFGPVADYGEAAALVRNLSPAGDLREAAANIFAALRELDASGLGTIAVMAIPEAGLGLAINDRLRRAAAPR